MPAAGKAVETTKPTTVVGNGNPASCTSAAVVAAVAKGGIITFSCGPNPVTITMDQTAKVRNSSQLVVLDGQGKVTLDGAGKKRILLQDTCDKSLGKGEPNCTAQPYPKLVVQNMRFINGQSVGQPVHSPWSPDRPEGGGGAMFVRGGLLSVINSTFVANRCEQSGPDIGGAAIRALDMYHDGPVYVVSSTFTSGRCSNGSGLSSIGVSWEVLNSSFTDNQAVGKGANPARPGTPGGGSGGAIYTDGNTYTVHIAGSRIENNSAQEGGGAIFFVSNDKTGKLIIDKDSTVRNNISKGFQNYPGIFFLGASIKR